MRETGLLASLRPLGAWFDDRKNQDIAVIESHEQRPGFLGTLDDDSRVERVQCKVERSGAEHVFRIFMRLIRE